MPNSEGARAKFGVGALLFALVVAWLAWGDALELGLFAWDTFPLIAAGRFSDWDSFVSTLSSELMGGRFPGGHYWRPLVHLSFGLDYALWGLDARGYHLTDFALLGLNGALVIALARALVGQGRTRWAYLAGLVFLLHPVHFEVVPLPPRRADALALAFTLLALFLTLRRPGRLSVGAAFAALAAVASKETGALAPLLLFAFGAAAVAGDLKERAVAGLRAAWLALALVGLFLAGRALLLGGLGGGARATLPDGGELGGAAGRYAQLVLAPLPPGWVPEGMFATALAAALTVVLLLGVWRARPGPEGGTGIDPRAAAAALGVWCLALIVLTAASGVYRAWYALPFAAPLALLVGLAIAVRGLPGGGGSLRVLGASVVLVLFQGWLSDGERRWDELRASSAAATRFLVHFDEVVESLVPGSTAELAAFPPEGSATRHGRDTARTLIFREYSLRAYAELEHPDKPLRIAVLRDVPERAGPDEVLVLLVPRPPEGGAR